MSEQADSETRVDEFLELERELSAGRKTAGTYDEGNVAEAGTVPAGEVPDDYPVEIRTARALQLDVETPDGETATTKWVVGALVPITNVSVGLAYLVDRRVRLSGTAPGDVSETWHRGVLAGLAAPILGLVLFGVSETVGALAFFYGLLFLPFAVYFDAEYVEDATDWDPNEELWAVGALALGPFAAAVYLLKRRQALD